MKALRPLVAVLMLGMWATAAYGDGGTMLLHQDAGAFTVTLFAAPRPLQVGAADLSVMVQDRASGDVLLDPIIDLTIVPETGNAMQQTVRLGKGQASDRLLQAATVHFSSAGKWRLMLLRVPAWQRRGSPEHGMRRGARSFPRHSGVVLCFVAGGHHSAVCHPPGIEASLRGES